MKLVLTFLLVISVPAAGQAQMRDNREKQLSCDNVGRDRARICEVYENTIGPSGMLDIQPGSNGAVSIKGWAQNSVLVRGRLEVWAETDSEARSIASQVRLDTAGGRIYATGPDWQGSSNWNERRYWSMSLEIFAPWNTDIKLSARNGGVTISDLRGRMEFEARNGKVQLTRLAGDVTGEARNGGIQVDLEGNTWDGRQLSLTTRNGAITLNLPASYSASIEAQSDRSRLNSDFPVTVRGRLDEPVQRFNIGAGGPLISLHTRNGGVNIRNGGR
jgi:hypothetical protein